MIINKALENLILKAFRNAFDIVEKKSFVAKSPFMKEISLNIALVRLFWESSLSRFPVIDSNHRWGEEKLYNDQRGHSVERKYGKEPQLGFWIPRSSSVKVKNLDQWPIL